MPGFVERVEVEATGGRRDRARQVAGRQVRRGQLVQDRHHGPFDGDRPRRPPIVEFRAVAQVEAGQERAARQGRGRGQRPPRIRAGEALQLREVDPNPRGIERNASAIDEDRSGPAAARSDDSVRRRAPFAADCVRIGPEQRRELVPRERSPFRAEQGEDRHGLAGIHDEWGAVHQHLRRPEQPDVEAWRRLLGHGVTVLILAGSLVTFQ